MQVLPINTVSIPSSASTSSVGSVSSSSKDIASSTLTPSVTVSISSTNKAEAITNIAVPPVYSRVSVGASTTNQLSPSRNSIERPTIANPDQKDAPELDLAGRPIESDNNITDDSIEEQAIDEAKTGVTADQSKEQNPNQGQLTEEQLEVVQALQARDREVRAHEQAHKSVGGSLAGAVSYSYQSAPNGQRYAVGGEVPIDASPVNGDPAATIRKMNVVRAAATAPVDPSAQDQSVAAAASRVLAQARQELAAENIESQKEQSNEGSGRDDSTSAEKNTLNSAEIRTTFESEYEEVIAPLESKPIEIDEIV